MEVRGLGVTASILSVCFVWSATTADEAVHPICPLVLHQERVDREELELAVDLAVSRLAAAESIFTLVDQLWEKDAHGADDVLLRGNIVFAEVLHAGQDLATVGQIDFGDRQVFSDTMTVDLQVPPTCLIETGAPIGRGRLGAGSGADARVLLDLGFLSLQQQSLPLYLDLGHVAIVLGREVDHPLHRVLLP